MTSQKGLKHWLKANIAKTITQKLVLGLVILSLNITPAAALNGGAIQNLEVEPETFDPYANEETYVRFDLTQSAEVDVKVYDDNDNHVYSIEKNEDLDPGTYEFEWDGWDKDDEIVEDGDYTIKIEAELLNGFTDYEQIDVEVAESSSKATISPRIRDFFLTKQTFDPGRGEETTFVFELTAKADLAVYITKGSQVVQEVYSTNNAAPGTYKIEWNGRDYLGDLVPDGESYAYSVLVKNSEGKDKASGRIKVEEDEEMSQFANIYDDQANPSVFTPLTETSMKFDFKVSKSSYGTITILDDGEIVATPYEGNFQYGSNSFKWYGDGENGEMLTDGIYTYIITTENSAGESTDYGKFMIKDSYKKTFEQRCGGFTDVDQNDDNCDAIEWAEEEGIFEGYTNGTFQPNKVITRVEALKVVLEAVNYTILKENGSTFGFSDLDGDEWHQKYIRTGIRYGIVEGYSDGTFRPDQLVTKAEAAVMTLRALEVEGCLVIPTCSSQPYADVPLHTWYTNAACFIHDFEITDDKWYFNPDEHYSRGDMAELLYGFHVEGLL
jgi:flagellar hook assembly protein FlgD